MCGICGIIDINGYSLLEDDLKIMLSHLKSRGPDHTGLSLQEKVLFGHRRLSIIDLSDSGNQPMVFGDLSITFNGEIYNFPELKLELSNHFSFDSKSDTEVLLKGFRLWGMEKLLSKINGMFAFAIYDDKLKALWLARDRFGEKPLYYLLNDKKLAFASEINSLYYTEKKLTLNLFALDYYLSELAMRQPMTIWNEILQLEAAHFLKLDITTGKHQIKKYWDLKNIEINNAISEEEAIHTTERILLDSMKARTISDVPFACFLSGGIDSGLIVSMLASNGYSNLKTFTIGYDNSQQNEAPLAKKLADRYSTDHTEIILKPEVIDALEFMVGYIGEPFADPSIIPTYYVCKAISSHVKMAISGDGGDEMFGGYFEFEFASKADEWRKSHPNKIARELSSAGGKLAYKLNLSKINPGHINEFGKQHPALFLYRQKGFGPFEKSKIYHKDFNFLSGANFTIGKLEQNWISSQKLSISDSFFTGSVYPRLNEYLVKVDRASMSNSLEVRTPFLDKNLSEFIFTIPANIKLKNHQTKYILKKLAVKYMDTDIFNRPKQGFGIPIDEWFRHELKDFMLEIIESNQFKSRKYFNQDYIQTIIQQHLDGKIDHTHRLWLLIVFELWCRKYLDGKF